LGDHKGKDGGLVIRLSRNQLSLERSEEMTTQLKYTHIFVISLLLICVYELLGVF